MELATWILVVILSVTLLIFLILGIVALIKFIKIENQAQIAIAKGQDFFEKSKDVADKAGDVVDNLGKITLVGGLSNLVKKITGRYNNGNGKSSDKNSNK